MLGEMINFMIFKLHLTFVMHTLAPSDWGAPASKGKEQTTKGLASPHFPAIIRRRLRLFNWN